MKTLPLRTLLRDPVKVKRITATGSFVCITDKGEPLWELRPIERNGVDPERDKEIDAILDEVLREKPSKISISKLILDSRR
jgi:hypothetical protein